MAAKRSVDDVYDDTKFDIFKAILNGDASLVAKCIDGGCDVDRPGADGLTPLCAAIRNGESKIACLIIPHACLFRKERIFDDPSMSSLFRAFLLGDRRHRFIKNRIGNHLLHNIWSSLGFVATQSVLNILLSPFDARVMCVLHLNDFRVYSVIRTDIVRRYVSRSIVPLIENASKQDQMSLQHYRHRGTNLTFQGYTALDHLLEYGGNIEPVMLELLIAGLLFDNVNETDGYALRIWEWAASKGHMKVVTILLGMGIDPDAGSGLALGIACYELNVDLCKYLLHLGASVNLRQCSENGCLWLGSKDPAIVQCAKGILHGKISNYPQAKQNAFSIMEALIDYGEDINQIGQNGETALSSVCVDSQCWELVMFLLNRGALPNIADKKGNTPLHKASHPIQAPLLTTMLLEAGANPNVINERGETPMNCAAFDGGSVLNLQLLVDAADPANLDWDTLLYQASRYGSLQMLKYLLSKGANPTTEVKKDDCALFAAMRTRSYQYKEATLLLLHHEASHNFLKNSSRSSLHNMLGERKALELGDLLLPESNVD